jgi:hypothetical protein
MNDCRDGRRKAHPAYLVLIDQSGAKREIPQQSPATGMIEAEQAMRRPGWHLRAAKVVSQNKTIARWKADELRWRRVALTSEPRLMSKGPIKQSHSSGGKPSDSSWTPMDPRGLARSSPRF